MDFQEKNKVAYKKWMSADGGHPAKNRENWNFLGYYLVNPVSAGINAAVVRIRFFMGNTPDAGAAKEL